MFDDIPENYRSSTADNEEEGWRYTQGDKSARRPPELLTRDHVARCINREVKAGRGSPHGGVFLDIAWIKEKLPNSVEHIKKKLPSMYHQFKQLADLDITQGADGSGSDDALHDGRHSGGWRYADDVGGGLVRRGRMRGGTARSESAGREFALRLAGVRQARRRVRREIRQGKRGREAGSGPGGCGGQGGAGSVRARRGGRESVCRAERAAGRDAGPGRHRAHRKRNAAGAGKDQRAAGARREGRDHRQHRIQHRLAHGARSRQHAGDFRDDRDGGPRAQGKPRRALPRRLSRQERRMGQVQSAHQQGRRRAAASWSACRWCRSPTK